MVYTIIMLERQVCAVVNYYVGETDLCCRQLLWREVCAVDSYYVGETGLCCRQLLCWRDRFVL